MIRIINVDLSTTDITQKQPPTIQQIKEWLSADLLHVMQTSYENELAQLVYGFPEKKKATNPIASMWAMRAIKGTVVLLTGSHKIN